MWARRERPGNRGARSWELQQPTCACPRVRRKRRRHRLGIGPMRHEASDGEAPIQSDSSPRSRRRAAPVAGGQGAGGGVTVSARDRQRGRPRRVWPILLAGFGLMLWAAVQHQRGAGDGASAARDRRSAPTARWPRDVAGCLQPAQFHQAGSATGVKVEDFSNWVEAGSADRLGEDPCGKVWGLWYNSWQVHPGGNPRFSGHLAGNPALGLKTGVQAWVARRNGEFWTLDSQGVLRVADSAGNRQLPDPWPSSGATGLTPPHCGLGGSLVEFAGTVWLGCPGQRIGVFRWNPAWNGWQPMEVGFALDASALVVDGDRLLVAGEHGIGALTAQGEWHRLHDMPIGATRLAAAGDWIAAARDGDLWRWRRGDAQPLHASFASRVTGLVLQVDGRLWSSHAMDGLRHFDGQRWIHWTHARGLLENEGRDLLLDSRGLLWLAGTPSGVIALAAAAERVQALQEPPSPPVQRFADGCAAAAALLNARKHGAEPVLRWMPAAGVLAVAGESWCPFQPDSSALGGHRIGSRNGEHWLQLNFDGRRSYSSCGQPCTSGQARRFTELWGMRLQHRAANAVDAVVALPPPDPLPPHSPGHAAVDDRGTVWVGTRGGGLYRYADGGWHHFDGGELGREHAEIYLLFVDHHGALWLSRDDNTNFEPLLLRFQEGNWRHWTAAELGASWISAIADSRDGVLLASNGGVIHLRPQAGWQLERGDTGPAAEVQRWLLPGGSPRAVAEDPDGRIWVAFDHDPPGIAWLDRNGELQRWTGREGLFAEHVRRLAFDAERRLWLQSSRGEVAVYAEATWRAQLGPAEARAAPFR